MEWVLASTDLEENYKWKGHDAYAYVGIAIVGVISSEEDILQLDAILDNSDLSTDKLRKTPNGRDTYILEA
jgi:hypothetical protein